MKIPRLGAGERAVNVISFEVCRTVLGALAQGPHHPTLVAYGDVETTPYLVMEYVEGARLDDWVGRAPLAPEEIARLGSALALALHDLHRQDVVHLDLKPTNVLYRASGEAVLIDFGLAHHSHYPDLLAEELRFPVGNWVYMAPEQVLGVRCDPRSDISRSGRFSTSSPPAPSVRQTENEVAVARGGSIAIRSRRGRSSPRRPHGCRKSSCIVSKSTPATDTRRPHRSRSTWRILRRLRSPSAARGIAAWAGGCCSADGCAQEDSNPRLVRRHRPP